MSIATQISALQSDKTAIANAITAKGGTVNSGDGFDDFATDIGTIPTGGTSTKYGCGVDDLLGDVDSNGVLQRPSDSVNLAFPGVEDVAGQALAYKFYYSDAVVTASFPDLSTISGTGALQYMFENCPNVTTIDLGSLTTVSGQNALQYFAQNCPKLTSLDLSSLTTVSGANCMRYAFRAPSKISSIDLSSLSTISGSMAMQYAFSGAKISSLSLNGLTTVSGSQALQYAFSSCTSLRTVNIDNLPSISGQQAFQRAFDACTALTSVSFANLTTIGTDSSTANYGHFSYAFNGCTYLFSLTFPKLEKIYCTGGNTASYGTFAYNDKVQTFNFPKLNTITYGSGASSTNQNACKYIFSNCTSLTKIHFGSANQAAIQASPGYSTLWGRGAGNATIYFDL